mgnify:CR=1 FL=1
MATKYLSYKEREVIKDSIKGVERALANPDTAQAIRRKDRMMRTYQNEKKVLETKSPPPIADETDRHQVAEQLARGEQAMIAGNPTLGVDPMPTRHQMWETPAGAIGQNTNWQQYWKSHFVDNDGTVRKSNDGYGEIFRWKDRRARFFAEREADDPDVRNIEIIRPDKRDNSSLPDYRSRSWAPGGNMSHEEWNLATGHQPTALEAAVVAAEATASVPGPEKIYAGLTPDAHPRRCTGTSKTTKRQCNNMAEPDSNYCGYHEEKEDGA